MVLPNFCWANSDSDATEQNISRRKLDLFNPIYVNSRNNETNQQENINQLEINDAQMENQENHEKEEQIKRKPSFTSSNGYYGYSMIQNSNANNVNNLSENHNDNLDLEIINSTIGTENFNETRDNCLPILNIRKRYYVADTDHSEDFSKYSKRRRCKLDMSHECKMDFDQLMEDDQILKQHEQQEQENITDPNSMQIESEIERPLPQPTNHNYTNKNESYLIKSNINNEILKNDNCNEKITLLETLYSSIHSGCGWRYINTNNSEDDI